MALSKPGVDPKNGLYKIKIYNPKTDFKEYKAPKVYKPPPYKDPLRQKTREYKGHFEIPEYKPYIPKPVNQEYREYKGPCIDPLTGKSYKKGRQKDRTPTPEEEVPEEAKKPVPKVYISFNRFGKTPGSTTRTIQMSKNLEF